jgi:hypothetical protein
MMPFIPLSPWIAFSLRAAQIGFAAQNVIALRLLRLAAGGTRAYNETARMSIEKTTAFAEAQVAAAAAAMAGRSNPAIANRALTPIKKRVYANKRRLSRR